MQGKHPDHWLVWVWLVLGGGFLLLLALGWQIDQAWVQQMSAVQATFWGAAFGALFGLLAILAGALLNAHLNRGRDDRLRLQESVALSTLILAELFTLEFRLRRRKAHVDRLAESEDGIPVLTYRSFKLPNLPLIEAVADRLSYLPAGAQGYVASVIALIDETNTDIDMISEPLVWHAQWIDSKEERRKATRVDSVVIRSALLHDEQLLSAVRTARIRLEEFLEPHMGTPARPPGQEDRVR